MPNSTTKPSSNLNPRPKANPEPNPTHDSECQHYPLFFSNPNHVPISNHNPKVKTKAFLNIHLST